MLIARQNPDETTAELFHIPDGAPGIGVTLAMMSELSRAGKKSPVVIRAARDIIAPFDQKDWIAEISSIHAFVRDHVRYVNDPHDVEMLQTPEKTLEFMAGDCDDKSILVASLLGSIGHPCRYRAVGMTPGVFEHVYVETKIGNDWIPVETTEPVELGWQPPERDIRVSLYRKA